MQEICLSKIDKSYGFNRMVLNEFDFEAHTGERIALIGANGSGKTTVFRIITGEEGIQGGIVSIRKGVTIGYLNQIPSEVTDDVRVKTLIMANLEPIFAMEKRLRDLETKMALITDTKTLDKILKTYGRLQEEYEVTNGYAAMAKVSKICNGFKINDGMLERSFNSLSGGEKTLVNLAALMISEPSILLLDEPTNHLDIDTLEWFETYLNDYAGTVIISSHDRYFLDRVVNKVVLIEKGKSEVFHGNYSYYLIENESRIMHEFMAYKNQQKQIQAMKQKIKQLQTWGKLANPGGEAFFKRAASIQKRLDKLEVLDKPEDKKDLPLDFKVNHRSGQDALVVNNLAITLGTKQLFSQAAFTIRYGEKVCLMGKNGTGKSTLIKAVLGELTNYNGEIKVGSNVILGYLPQVISFPDENEALISYARKCFYGDETQLRSALVKFLFFNETIKKRVGKLSGGEKVRLKLFELIGKQANFLILDEPTNHIDIDTREVLEEALRDFKGTVLFISHDRYFVNKIAQGILYIDEQIINYYLGDYDYFKNHKKKY